MTEDEAKTWIDANMSGGGFWNDAQSLAELVNAKLEACAKLFAPETMRCTECGEPMRAPIALYRCSAHPSEHQEFGPGIAFEIRVRSFPERANTLLLAERWPTKPDLHERPIGSGRKVSDGPLGVPWPVYRVLSVMSPEPFEVP